jgi:hypothetical protein
VTIHGIEHIGDSIVNGQVVNGPIQAINPMRRIGNVYLGFESSRL